MRKPATSATGRKADRAAAAAALAAVSGAETPAQAESGSAEDGDPEAETPPAQPAAAAADPADDGDDDCECADGTAPEDCDCDDEIDDDDANAQAARGRERARCIAIFTHPNAIGREPNAAKLAANPKLTRGQARALLADMGAVEVAKPSGLAAAMSTVRPPKPNSGGAPSARADEKSIAAGWDRALKKA